MSKAIIRKVNSSKLQIAGILLIFTVVGSFLYFNSSASSTTKPPYPLGCESSATNVSTAAALRTAVSNGQNACVTAAVGNVDLSGINRANPVYVGTSSGSIGAISIVGSRNIVIRQARVRSVDIRDSQFITIEKSTLGGTSSVRVLDNIITSLGYSPGIDTSDDVTIQDNDIGWTTADTSGNTGYGIRVYGGDRFKVQRNYIHHIGADGIQMGSDGKDNVIDRNEFAYIAPPPSSDEHSDDIQITGHGPNLRITNNYLHHNGWQDAGGSSSGGSGPYIHGGSTGSLLFENNLVRDERNYMQVADLGTGGTSKSNLTFRRNTFFNNGTMWPNPPDLSWQINSGSNNILERNVVNDNFGNKYGFGTHTSANNNLNGAAYTIDNQGECTVAACNPASQEPIGYRCPTDVWWCSNSTTPPPPIDTSVANIWVNTSAGTSPSKCAPACTYTTSSAYGSVQSALAASSPGDIIRVKTGSYGSQAISSVKSSPGVTVIAEPNTVFAGLSVTGAWVEIQNVAVNGGLSIQNTGVGMPNNITFRNVDWNGGWWLSNCCDNIKQIGGRIHNVTAASAPTAIMMQGLTASTPISNITLDGVEIDHMSHSVAGSHFEAVRTQGWATGINIRNSWFHDNGVNSSQIFISSFTGGTSHTPGPIVIEGNRFDPPVSGAGDPPAYYNINGNLQGLGCPDLTVRQNTSDTALISGVGGSNFWNCSGPSNVIISGNITPRDTPICDATYSYNLFIGSGALNCGAGDKTVASASAAGLTGDGFHISSTSPALDSAGPNCPSKDADGDSRPQGTACDIGADELSSSSPPTSCTPAKNLGNINCDSKVDIFDLSIILSNYGKNTALASNPAADLNNSGSIDGTDLSILLSNYGT